MIRKIIHIDHNSVKLPSCTSLKLAQNTVKISAVKQSGEGIYKRISRLDLDMDKQKCNGNRCPAHRNFIQHPLHDRSCHTRDHKIEYRKELKIQAVFSGTFHRSNAVKKIEKQNQVCDPGHAASLIHIAF